MFTQILDPTGNLFVTWLVALVPVLLLLFLLAVLRMSAWQAVLIGSVVTFLLALWVWKMPLGDGALAYLYGSATGIWNVDWITFWGVMLFNTLVTTGSFEKLRRWLVQQGTRDVRVQTILFAWAFGALLEGLVGLRVSLGLRRANPDRHRHSRSRRHPGRGHRQQCAGLLRRVGSADHCACHGNCRHARHDLRRIAADLLGVGRQDRRHPRFVAALDPALSGIGQQRHVVGVAARHRRVARLYRGAITDRGLSRPLSAGRDRRDRLLCRTVGAAQSMAAGASRRLTAVAP